MDKTILRMVKHLKSDIEIILDEFEHEFFLSEDDIYKEYASMTKGNNLGDVLKSVNIGLAKIIEDVRPKMYSYVCDQEHPGWLKREFLKSRSMIAGAESRTTPQPERVEDPHPKPETKPTKPPSRERTPIVQPPPGFVTPDDGSASASRSSSLAPGSNRPGSIETPLINGRPPSPKLPMSFDYREKESVIHPKSRPTSAGSYSNLNNINHMGHEPKPLTDEQLKHTGQVLIDECRKQGYGEFFDMTTMLGRFRHIVEAIATKNGIMPKV